MARILIVEDEEKIARFVTLELEHEGYQVEHAADGRTAVDLALERDYDLILLDVLLPQLNGMEVLRRVRKHKDVPVIMVTARDAVMDKVAGLDAGADDYLTKPFAIEELFARIRVALKRSEAVRTASGRARRATRAGAPLRYPRSATQPRFPPRSPPPRSLWAQSCSTPTATKSRSAARPSRSRPASSTFSPCLWRTPAPCSRASASRTKRWATNTWATPTTSTYTSRTCVPRSRTPAAPASSRPCAGWAMSAVRNAEAKRVTSIARAINWSYMWRRLMSYIWLDLLLVVIAAAILVYGYNQTLPDDTFTAGWIPGATVHGMSLTPARGWDPTTLTYTVELARTTKTFPLAQDLVTLWPLYLVVVGWQVISVLNMLGGARRVRRTMAPLNDLALRVDELGRMQLSGGKMETLEQAIARASVDSPSVTTGDADLTSIEVALNRLLRQMQEAKLQQMRFVNDASHELRTPIAVIQGYVNMLDRWGKDDPDVLAESIASLKAESEHMQELVEQLLFLARGDAGRTVLRRANTNLAALVGEVCEESQMIDTEHTYRLAFDAALVSDPRCDAPVDVALVKQALRVIVQNAAKYSDAGTPISFGVASDAGAGTIDISVEDEGIGMNQESAAHAFERFYRADNVRDAGAQGSGLGLAIAKWIVDSHGGVIGVTSVEGVGSRFTIRLPR